MVVARAAGATAGTGTAEAGDSGVQGLVVAEVALGSAVGVVG